MQDELQEIYARIPTFKCEEGCTMCCQPTQEFSEEEWLRLPVNLRCFPTGFSCAYRTPKGCGIYEYRPLICRLYGSSEKIKCIKGRGPEKLLSLEETNELLKKYRGV